VSIDIMLPELGENIETGDVVQVLVAPGDTVTVDQPVIEVETDKATVEVPSSAEGTVESVAVTAGDTIAVGQLIMTIGGAASQPRPQSVVPTDSAASTPDVEETSPGSMPPLQAAPAPAEPDVSSVPVVATGSRSVLAAPSVRRAAREFGVDLNGVVGTGARGRVTLDDVQAHSRQLLERAHTESSAASSEPALPDFTRWGLVERVPMRGVRRATARQMSLSWRMVPRVTQHDRADITQFETVRKKLKKESADVPLTVTAFTVQVLTAALRKFPQFNASIDLAREEIVYKKYVHVGVAVDTDRGLLVPVIKDADQKSLVQLAREISALAEKARTKGVSVEDLEGGTFTVTNLGGLGGTMFTPIVNYPEVGILGLSRAEHAPVLVDQTFEPRLMLPLSLSYDHRLIDGADAVRFLRWVAERLEQPLLLSLGEI